MRGDEQMNVICHFHDVNFFPRILSVDHRVLKHVLSGGKRVKKMVNKFGSLMVASAFKSKWKK